MSQAIRLWSIWQDLLRRLAAGFTKKGFPRFREWTTAMALNGEEHTVTQSGNAASGADACAGGLRRRLCPEVGGRPAGPARGRLAAGRLPDAIEARRAAVRAAAEGAARGPSRQEARLGPAAAAAATGGPKVPWQTGIAYIYGRLRRVRWKEVTCLWHVLGHETAVKVVAAEVEGYKKRFALVTSAVKLSGLQMVELFAARFRQEDGFRDLKQRLGWEECRAWTRNPIERTTQVQWVAMSLMRLAQFQLEADGGKPWWSPPPWNRRKDRPSVLDIERLFRRRAAEIRHFLSNPEGVARNSAATST